MPLVPRLRIVPVRPPPHVFAVRALEVSLGYHFQRLDIGRLIGDDLLEAAILIFEFFESPQIADSRPPYFACQLYSVGPEMPCFRQMVAAFTPALSSLRMPTIWDSVNRDLRMWNSFRGRASDSTYLWWRLVGTRQTMSINSSGRV